MAMCPTCGETASRYGKTRDGRQRYCCADCAKTFSDPKPLAGMQTPVKQAAMALNMLLEGMSVRAAARITGLSKNAILRFVVKAGEQCDRFLAYRVVDIPATDVQLDEQWSFIYSKEKTAAALRHPEEYGDSYVFTAIDRYTKLLLCFHVGKRTPEDTHEFSVKLAGVVSGRPHVSTDGYGPYKWAVPSAFEYAVDHGVVVKQYGNTDAKDQRRYSPARIIGIKFQHNAGEVQPFRITTSHVERHNLSNRMHNRRFARLTNAFSKKWENHHAMFALWAAFYNFCRVHMTLETTPAVEAGLAAEPWSLEKLLRESARAAIHG